MSRPIETNEEMSDFARWLIRRVEDMGTTIKAVSVNAEIDESYLHKILHSYKQAYKYYKRPSYDVTYRIGECLHDVPGALAAAAFPPATPEELVDTTVRLLSPLNEKISRLSDTQRRAVDALLDSMVAGGDSRA